MSTDLGRTECKYTLDGFGHNPRARRSHALNTRNAGTGEGGVMENRAQDNSPGLDIPQVTRAEIVS